ncbi:unnamed protein product [Adineta ricciae]|uniref:G-protein coupled receptors family 1 profile domain-containing protein n=1 Tax=Adineta ricciae TaxID=249248 RepID=A0A815QA17_ADIRI|nr:unnamed protein product [Adineta ricciae]CAF1460441.1 unnamed protein product [Adineta ricciae]
MSAAAFLYAFQRNLFKYVGPLLIGIGTTSCLLNLLVFTQNTLRKNPCAIYLITVNSVNLMILYFIPLPIVFSSGYGVDPSGNNLVFCRLRFYLGFLLSSWESSCLILASIDRTLVTSSNALTRKRSTRRLAITSVICVGLFWTIFHVHALVYSQIFQYAPGYSVCYFTPGAYNTFITYYGLSLNGVIPPLFMLILGFWTVKNIRKVRHATQHSGSQHSVVVAVGKPQILESKDRQLIRMLLVEIVTYILCKTPIMIFLIYREVTRDVKKNEERNLIEQYVLLLTSFVFYIENSIGCYANILVSKTFRVELKRILLNVRQMCVASHQNRI